MVHQLEHEIFEDHAQAARAYLALQSQVRDGFERVVGEPQAHILKLEQPLILTDERVLGFRQYLHERAFVQVAQDTDHRQASHEFGDQTVADQIGRLHLFQHFDIAALQGGRLRIRVEAE